MTGTITAISSASGSGVIAGKNGFRVPFEIGAVMAFDQAGLVVGQQVTYDVKSEGRATAAVNICVQRAHNASPQQPKQPSMVSLRYKGFDQTGSVRTYCFEWQVAGEDKKTFLVAADVQLFAQYHIGLQEGPSMCVRLLLDEMNALDGGRLTGFSRSLAEREFIACAASKAALKAESGGKRRRTANQEAAAGGDA